MEINFLNIEQFLFLDKNAQDKLPEFRNDFESWKISQMAPGLRQLGQKSLMNVLNGMNEEHLKKLSDYFGKQVFIGKLNASIVEHYNMNVENNKESEELCKYSEFREFCITRKKNEIKATFWR